MATVVLYTPQVLELATGLAAYPLGPGFALRAQARSPSCGSVIELGLVLDGDRVSDVGLRSQACAIGQASAAIFARSAVGRSIAEIGATAKGTEDWLRGDAPLPDWPGLDAIAAAREYPARHGAVMLPWNAAVELLS